MPFCAFSSNAKLFVPFQLLLEVNSVVPAFKVDWINE